MPFGNKPKLINKADTVVRILFDHSVFSLQSRGGISRYFCELVGHLQDCHDCSPHILAPLHMSRLLKESPGLPVTGKYMARRSGTHRLRQIINNLCSSFLLRGCKPDIIHGTYYLARMHRPAATPYVMTVFDMIHERFPDQLAAGEERIAGEKKRCMQQADQVICISEHTRKDVVELAGISEEKTTVVHLGCSFSCLASTRREKSLFSSPYLLYVGTRGRVKNFNRALRAYAQSKKLSSDLSLLCFGGGSFTSEELLLAKKLGLSAGQLIHFFGDDQMLANIYTNAVAMIYPSLYEGFGLPILEAMACDCPVLCSNTSSMPEVAGRAALLFDPLSKNELTACMEQVVYSASTRERLISAGRQRITHFSWRRCAEETVKVYNRCL